MWTDPKTLFYSALFTLIMDNCIYIFFSCIVTRFQNNATIFFIIYIGLSIDWGTLQFCVEHILSKVSSVFMNVHSIYLSCPFIHFYTESVCVFYHRTFWAQKKLPQCDSLFSSRGSCQGELWSVDHILIHSIHSAYCHSSQ